MSAAARDASYFGHAAVPVARRPEVAILSTGDELVMPGESPTEDQIFAANAFGLHAVLTREGALPRDVKSDPSPPGQSGALVWGDGVFANRLELEAWLRIRGVY